MTHAAVKDVSKIGAEIEKGGKNGRIQAFKGLSVSKTKELMARKDGIGLAVRHALRAYPQEACGVIVDSGYLEVENVAHDPHTSFQMPAIISTWPIKAVVHSHCAPRHDPWPTAADMRGQMASGVPWGIIYTDGKKASEPLWFGGHTLDEPLIGRSFIPGVYDCYALIRAWYWQERGVKLQEFPRDANWWKAGGDLFQEGFARAGFQKVERDPEPGDVILMQLHSKVPNHGAVMLEGGLLLHHLERRLSRREPFNPWRGRVTHVLRYQC